MFCSSDNSYGSEGFGVLLRARKKFLAPADELHSRQQVRRMEQLSISCHDREEANSSPLLKEQQLQPAGPRATSCGCGHFGFGSFKCLGLQSTTLMGCCHAMDLPWSVACLWDAVGL